jgi:hypothetical protein
MKILHQLGHNYIWNLDSYLKDKAGDGLIISPVDISLDELKHRFAPDVLRNSYFDPQLYMIKNLKPKLRTYPYVDFFNSTSITESELDGNKDNLAVKCTRFQYDNEFSAIIIPAQHMAEVTNQYFRSNVVNFRNPFIKSLIGELGMKPLYLTVILNNSDVLDEERCEKILNHFTSIPQIDGVYLIFDFQYSSKQIKDPKLLLEAMKFIHILRLSGLKIIVAYSNLEGLLYAFAGADAITMGSYENTRKFTHVKFQVKEQSMTSQPKLKVFVRKMLQWINLDYLTILKDDANFVGIFDDNIHFSWDYSSAKNWHLNQPGSYKHFFLSYSSLVKDLAGENSTRYDKYMLAIENAISLFKQFETEGVFLDPNQNEEHLYAWKTALNKFNNWMKAYG